MSLKEQADAFRQQFLEQVDPGTARCVGAGLEALTEQNPAARALRSGDRAPDFERPDIFGGTVSLSRLLRQGPVVISFFRGSWCPFCSLELRSWQQHLDALHEAGAGLLAISPEATDQTRTAAQADGLGFPIVVDADQSVAEGYGLAYELPAPARAAQTLLDAPLDRLNADGTWRLPVPATYVVDRARVICWAFVENDYTRRAEPAEVLDVVRSVQQRRRRA